MFLDFLGKYKDFGLLLMRLGIGASYIYVHGWGKISGGPDRWRGVGNAMGNLGVNFLPVVWGFAAACTEFVGGIFILLGFFFRPSVVFIIIVMIVAALNHVSNGDPFSRIAYPLEMAFALTGLLFLGPGKYNLEKYL